MAQIKPVKRDGDDERPLIVDLLEKYSSEVQDVRKTIQNHDYFDSDLYDNIWILRFVLSHKGAVAKAAKAAKDTMKFRHKYRLNEIDDICVKVYGEENVLGQTEAAPVSPPFAYPVYKAAHDCVEKYSMMMSLPDLNRGLIVYFLAKGIDMSKMIDKFTDDDLFMMHMYQKEAVQHINDEVTRRTGRLTKMVRIIDMTGCSFSDLNYSYLKKESANNKRLEDFYPQSMGATFMVNPPTWCFRMYQLFKPLMTKRLNEKFSMISPTENPKDAGRLLRYVSFENLSQRYGGKNKQWPPLYTNEVKN